jgi:hypothetical protein
LSRVSVDSPNVSPERGASLVREAFAPVRIGRDGDRQRLERHFAIELRVVGDEHFAHTAGDQRFENPAVTDSRANHGGSPSAEGPRPGACIAGCDATRVPSRSSSESLRRALLAG